MDSGQRLGTGDTRCVALGDLDGDHDLDAFAANTGSPSRIWLNDGNGMFTDSGVVLPEGACGTLGDLDGDGDLDGVLVGSANRMLVNPGDGRLRPGERFGEEGGAGVVLIDQDADGHLETFVSRFGFPEGLPNQLWASEGNGRFRLLASFPSQAPSMRPSAGDLNGDGMVEIIVANQADSLHEPVPDEIWWGMGAKEPGASSLVFGESPTRFGSSFTYEIALGDVDNDGDLDAVSANAPHAQKADPSDRVFINRGDGTLLDSGQSLGDSYSLSVELGDLDDDGDLDAVVGTLGAGSIIWMNDGTGAFDLLPFRLETGNSMGLALGDLDGDDDLDLFVGNNTWRKGDGANQVWINQGARNQPEVPRPKMKNHDHRPRPSINRNLI